MIVSKRLEAVRNMVTPGLTVADIGCDHGYLAISLIKNKISNRVIACDVNMGPLMRAKQNAVDNELTDVMECRLADGLSGINPGEVGCIVLAGMGGKLMTKILKQGYEVVKSAKEIIVQPQSEIESVRRFLQDNGCMIISENMICEDDKFYPIIKAVHGMMNWEQVFLRYGKILLREENPVLHEFLIKEREFLANLLEQLKQSGSSVEVIERTDEMRFNLELCSGALELISNPGLFEDERILR